MNSCDRKSFEVRDIGQILRAIGAPFERDEIRDCRNPHTCTNLYGVQVDGDSANDTVRNMGVR